MKPVPFFSGALYRRQTCFVYLPPSYEDTDRSYPVIYLLHGMHQSESDWQQRGNAVATIEAMMSAGELEECIVVAPNDGGYGQGTFYLNWYDGTGNFEDYIVEDLIPFIDNQFRTNRTSGARSICGLSMGGYGAVMLALRHPDLFGTAASLSGALGNLSDLPYDQFRKSSAFPRMLGPQHGTYARQYNIFELAGKMVSSNTKPYLYFDCGREDYLLDHSRAFHHHLLAIGYIHQYNEFDGEHSWDYWSDHLKDALGFIHSHLLLKL